MKIPRYRVEYTDLNEISKDINVVSISTKYGIESIKDTFNIKVYDPNNEYDFKLNEKIKIYVYYSGESETIVMDGLITALSNEKTEKSTLKVIKGNNILEILLNHQVAADYTSKTVGYMINNLLQNASDSQPSDRQIVLSTESVTTGATKSTDYYSTYKPVFQHIEALATDAYTGDGDYIYYLNSDNEFVLKPRPTETVGTLNYSSSTIETKRTKDANDVVNFMIINCGKDLETNSITTAVYNESSIGLLGWRTKYEVREAYANYIKVVRPDITGNDDFRNAVKDLAEDMSQKIMNGYADGTDKFQILVPGNTGYSIGGNYDVIMPSAGYTEDSPKSVRLYEIEHNLNKSGFLTKLGFKEEL